MGNGARKLLWKPVERAGLVHQLPQLGDAQTPERWILGTTLWRERAIRSNARGRISTIHSAYYYYYLDMHTHGEAQIRTAVVVERDWIADAYVVTRSLVTATGATLAVERSEWPVALYDAGDVEELVYGLLRPGGAAGGVDATPTLRVG